MFVIFNTFNIFPWYFASIYSKLNKLIDISQSTQILISIVFIFEFAKSYFSPYTEIWNLLAKSLNSSFRQLCYIFLQWISPVLNSPWGQSAKRTKIRKERTFPYSIFIFILNYLMFKSPLFFSYSSDSKSMLFQLFHESVRKIGYSQKKSTKTHVKWIGM